MVDETKEPRSPLNAEDTSNLAEQLLELVDDFGDEQYSPPNELAAVLELAAARFAVWTAGYYFGEIEGDHWKFNAPPDSYWEERVQDFRLSLLKAALSAGLLSPAMHQATHELDDRVKRQRGLLPPKPEGSA